MGPMVREAIMVLVSRETIQNGLLMSFYSNSRAPESVKREMILWIISFSKHN